MIKSVVLYFLMILPLPVMDILDSMCKARDCWLWCVFIWYLLGKYHLSQSSLLSHFNSWSCDPWVFFRQDTQIQKLFNTDVLWHMTQTGLLRPVCTRASKLWHKAWDHCTQYTNRHWKAVLWSANVCGCQTPSSVNGLNTALGKAKLWGSRTPEHMWITAESRWPFLLDFYHMSRIKIY